MWGNKEMGQHSDLSLSLTHTHARDAQAHTNSRVNNIEPVSQTVTPGQHRADPSLSLSLTHT